MISSHVLSCYDKGRAGYITCFFSPLKHKTQIYGGGGEGIKIAVTWVYVVTIDRKSHTSLFSYLNIWHADSRQRPNSEKADTSKNGNQTLSLDPAA